MSDTSHAHAQHTGLPGQRHGAQDEAELGWAIGCNSLALPIVAVNALALKRLKLPRRDRQPAAPTT